LTVGELSIPVDTMTSMFTAEEREGIRAAILKIAREDDRISGGAMTGSSSVGKQDEWSDIDLAFGVRKGADAREVLKDYSGRMYREHGCLHHLDVPSGTWIYRVFLLSNTLQVDLAFAPESDFGAKAPTFKLMFGESRDLPSHKAPSAESMIGHAWLYALHARSSIARQKLWQAEYMISAMRDEILALACLREGLPVQHARGVDQLPADLTAPLEECLIPSLTRSEIKRAFAICTRVFVEEMQKHDPGLGAKLEAAVMEMAS
jgi:hypothetical protein